MTPPNQQVAAIIVAAGRGTRMNQPSQPKKQFRVVGGKTLLEWSVEAFRATGAVTSIVVVTGEEDISFAREALWRSGIATKVTAVVAGGATRQESVSRGLEAIETEAEWIMVHDAARPMVTPELILRVLEGAKASGAATAALAIRDTVKRVSSTAGTVIETLDRSELVAVQTPQAFRRDVLERAHVGSDGAEATDDAGLVERLGGEVRVVAGDTRNLKVTTEDDLYLAEQWLTRADESNHGRGSTQPEWDVVTGFGLDVHRLVEGRPLVLGGIHIEHHRGLMGHSDADVLVHAVVDALFGAAALGDIGTHFPDTDPRYKGADSVELLRVAGAKLRESGCIIVHVDAFISAEAPRLKPHIPGMRKRLAEAMGIGESRVSIKAGTGEGAGPVGRAEVIEARAVATVRRRSSRA